jgi:hypothetical protein
MHFIKGIRKTHQTHLNEDVNSDLLDACSLPNVGELSRDGRELGPDKKLAGWLP